MKKFCTTIMMVAFLAVAGTVYGDGLEFEAKLSGAQEVPPPGVDTDASGKIKAEFDEGLTQVKVKLKVEGLAAGNEATRAHFHCALAGANGDIAFGIVDPGPADCDPADLAAGDLECTLTNADFTGADCDDEIGRPVNNIAALAFAMREGLIYANVHTPGNRPGEIRGQMLEDNDNDDDDDDDDGDDDDD